MTNRESVDGKRFEDWDDDMLAHGPGAFVWKEGEAWHGRVILFILPGETTARHVHVNHGPPLGEGVWGWDGNEESPTLTPSIQAWNLGSDGSKRSEHWHGFLTAGRFVSC